MKSKSSSAKPRDPKIAGRAAALSVTCLALAGAFTSLLTVPAIAQAVAAYSIPAVPVYYRTIKVAGVDVFYREAGEPRNPTILLLHGFPSSSNQYRNLIPLLADKYHVVAPDYPGFGHSGQPDRELYSYTFDHLYETIDMFTKAIGVQRFVLYGHDYGVPVGLRFALHQPDRISAIIIQNGNAYDAGFTALWEPIKALWRNDSIQTRKVVSRFLNREGAMFEHSDGMTSERVDPDSVDLDTLVFDRPGNRDVQLDLFADYKSNLALYPAFHESFRRHQFPMLIIWGKKDPSFGMQGAEAFRQDLPSVEVHFIDDAGDFACETHAGKVAAYIRAFLPSVSRSRP